MSFIGVFLRHFLGSRRGNVAIITALVAPVLIGFCGLGADAGYWYYRQRDLQSAVDIAAYNGAVALQNSGTLSVITDASTTGASDNGWASARAPYRQQPAHVRPEPEYPFRRSPSHRE